MKIPRSPGYLFVLPWELRAIGGVNQVVSNLFDKMQCCEVFQPILLVNDWNHSKPKENYELNRLTVKFRIRGPLCTIFPFKNFIIFLLLLPLNLFRLKKLLCKYNIKVVNAHYPTLSFFQFVILKQLGFFNGKLIVSLHGKDIEDVRVASGIERSLWKLILRGVDHVVTCSEGLRKDTAAFVSLPQDKLLAIHNGVDVEKMSQKRDNFSGDLLHDEKSTFILSVGTFEARKGQDILITAFSKLNDEFNNIDLVLIGRRTETITQLKKLAKELRIEKRVKFYEDLPHEKVMPFFRHAEMFVLPSRQEAFGIVILEAGVYSLPVVASEVGGIGEIIENNVDGILVQKERPGLLAEKMNYLLANARERERLGGNLNRKVINNFTWDKALGKYLSLAV